MSDEFAAFSPQPVKLEIADKSLEVTPVRVGDIPALLKAVRPFSESLATEEIDWLTIITEHGEAFIDAIAVTARQSREWVDALSLDEAIELATALFEVNVDFFIHRVEPAIQKATARIQKQVKESLAGALPSTG